MLQAWTVAIPWIPGSTLGVFQFIAYTMNRVLLSNTNLIVLLAELKILRWFSVALRIKIQILVIIHTHLLSPAHIFSLLACQSPLFSALQPHRPPSALQGM